MIELLAPAGSPEALDAAAGEGADAVYLGLKNFNARMRSANFAYAQLEGALRTLHRTGRKLYVTVNTVFEQREADRMYQLLKYLAGLGPDALIVQDFGVVTMARTYFPGLRLHASTQMNIASARGANALSRYGVSRVVLARELGLEEIRGVRAHTNAELEVFVHGALCVSASGICLFSSYLGGKSANRGMCTQACRRFYRGAAADTGEGYYFSPSDLELLDIVPGLADAGVTAFKIEGRMKSAEYVGTVVSAYRRVIDALAAGGAALEKALEEGRAILRNDFARAKTRFYFENTLDWLNPERNGGVGIALGKILRTKGTGDQRLALIELGEKSDIAIAEGDSLRFHRADDSARVAHKVASVQAAETGGAVWVSVPEGFEAGDAVYLIQTRSMAKRYPPVIPREGVFKRAPGREKAPHFTLPPPKAAAEQFPEGLYPLVGRVDDLYIAQAAHSPALMLAYTRQNAATLLTGKPLPFPAANLILVLDPYLPESLDAALAEQIPALMAKGFRRFVANNPGHFAHFRSAEAAVIAGPYLYAFNRWAQALIAELGADFFVSPLENNRQNLERTAEPARRKFAFVTVFCYPPLFRIRADLSGRYPFDAFADSQGAEFHLRSGPDGSVVYPEKPFSITDKVPFLKEAGFRRFILDMSGFPLKKAVFRDLLTAAASGSVLPGGIRFNWKDGFFQNEVT